MKDPQSAADAFNQPVLIWVTVETMGAVLQQGQREFAEWQEAQSKIE